jgi:hypothetical protein
MAIGVPVNRLPRSRESLAPYFPVPLVGSAVLLAVLILLTPNLLSSSSPTAGSLASQAELLVDRGSSNGGNTDLYLRGIGLARYTSLELRWSPLNSSNAPASLDGLHWRAVAQANGSLGIDAVISDPAFAVNASAVYVDSSGTGVSYSALFAFSWSGDVLATTAYGAAAGSGTTPQSEMPLILLLVEGPYGGGP